MPCFNPGWVSLFPGGRRRYGEHPDALGYEPVSCNKCEGCQRRKVSDWKAKLYLTAFALSPAICATLTYSPERVPSFGSLRKADVSDFVRRFRRLSGLAGVKFHAIGEYSPAPAQRPHVHISLFGVGECFNEPEAFNTSKAGRKQYRSRLLDDAWRERGLVTFQFYGSGAADYVSGHEAGKATRRDFFGVDPATGERVRLEPEFLLVSRGAGGGIGRAAFEKYGAQLVSQDKVVYEGGFGCALPRSFDRYVKADEPSRFEAMKAKRLAARAARDAANPLEFQPGRLAVIEECQVLDRKRRRSLRTLG